MLEQVDSQQNTANKQNEKLDNTAALRRFIWLRSVEPVFNNEMQWKLSKEYDHEIKNVMTEMIEVDPTSVANTLQKSAPLKCTDETLWCLSFCLSESKNQAACSELRKIFLQIVSKPADLLFFMKNYSNCVFFVKNYSNIVFSSGLRNCVTKWYDNRSPTELLEMIFASEKFQNLGHADIVKRLHPKSENPDKNEVFAAAFKNYNEIKQGAATSTTLKKILRYKDLKRCTDIGSVVAILKLKEFNFKLQHLPTFATKSPEVIELILPNLTLAELVENLPTFADKKLLKDTLSKKICNALQGSAKTINEAKFNPVLVFEVIKKLSGYEAPMIKKEEFSGEKEKKVSNLPIVQKLRNIFNQSLNEQTNIKTGCRFFVTVNFRQFSKRQRDVKGMKQVSCQEAQAIMALTLLKNEKEVTVVSFSHDKNKLKPVSWTRETSFEKALEIYDKEISEKPKTKENIILPLKKAAEDKKQVDVFIVCVTSVGRSMGTNAKPPQEELQSYQEAMKLNMAKLVIINMTRKKSDFSFSVNSKGILEIIGFGPNTMKVIEAFAKNLFN